MDKTELPKNYLSDDELNEIYAWVDTLELSRPKKNIARDFSDALLVAETIKCYYPKLVELHNYPPTHNIKQKNTNWATLNRKVFNRMGFQILKNDIEDIVNGKQMAIEKFLMILKVKVDKYRENYKEDTTVNIENLAGFQNNQNGSNMGNSMNGSNLGSSQNNQMMNYNNLNPQQMQAMYGNDQVA